MLEHKDRLVQTAANNVLFFGEFDVAKTPLLSNTVEMARTHPEQILQCFATYDMVIRDLFNLKPEELRIIHEVNSKLGKTRGADEFINHMQPYKTHILDIIHHTGGLESELTQQGVAELASMMKNAAQLKEKEPNWKPTDGDPRSDNVIWGFVNGATDPKTNIDFIMCHGIERIVTQSLRKENIEYTKHKDWLVSAMTDIVALRGLQGKYPENKLLSQWSQRRPNGLGWISQQRLDAYEELGVKNDNRF